MKDSFEQLDALYQSGKVAEVGPFLEKTLERLPNPEKKFSME